MIYKTRSNIVDEVREEIFRQNHGVPFPLSKIQNNGCAVMGHGHVLRFTLVELN